MSGADRGNEPEKSRGKLLAFLFALLLPVVVAGRESAQFYVPTSQASLHPKSSPRLASEGPFHECKKATAMLENAKRDGYSVSLTASNAVKVAGYTNLLVALATYNQLRVNHQIADRFGVFDEVGMDDMRRGKSPTITRGPHKGDELSVDHIVPYAVVPELDNVIANLELMPFKLNREKNSKMGTRQRDMAKRFCAAGLLTRKRLEEILGKSN